MKYSDIQIENRNAVIPDINKRKKVKEYRKNKRDCAPETTTSLEIMEDEKTPISLNIEVVIGLGHNKYYKKDLNENALLIERFPIGFFLKFPLQNKKAIAYLESIFDRIFDNKNLKEDQYVAHLDICQFKQDCYPYFYFKNRKALENYLKEIASNISFYSTTKLGNKPLSLAYLLHKSDKAFQKIKSS